MTRLELLSLLLSLQLLGPALRIQQVAAFDVLMVIGKLSVSKGLKFSLSFMLCP